MEQPAAFRVQPGQFDNAVQSIGANRRCPCIARSQWTSMSWAEERMEPVNDLRIEIRKWSTTGHG
jgi:hypothetical protein